LSASAPMRGMLVDSSNLLRLKKKGAVKGFRSDWREVVFLSWESLFFSIVFLVIFVVALAHQVVVVEDHSRKLFRSQVLNRLFHPLSRGFPRPDHQENPVNIPGRDTGVRCDPGRGWSTSWRRWERRHAKGLKNISPGPLSPGRPWTFIRGSFETERRDLRLLLDGHRGTRLLHRTGEKASRNDHFSSSGQGTVSTGQVADRTTLSATEPKTNLRQPVHP